MSRFSNELQNRFEKRFRNVHLARFPLSFRIGPLWLLPPYECHYKQLTDFCLLTNCTENQLISYQIVNLLIYPCTV